MSEILSGLNEKQREAVVATEGYVRVAAGAGSGKTRVLCARYAYLAGELGIPAQNILCITFTNKAAREMKTRLRRILGDGLDVSFVSTLHGFCVRVLKEDIGRLFYPENFVILDSSDQISILEEVYEELGIKSDTATFDFMLNTKIRTFKNKILYGDYMVDPRSVIGDFEATDTEKKVIVRYMEKQKKYFGLDFFDIINFTVCLFKKHEDILQKWQRRLHYVMADEFQDTNTKEIRLIRILTEHHQNLFVAGDPDQNIYEWRSAKMEIFVEFERYIRGYFTGDDPLPSYWPDHVIPPMKADIKTVVLEENYRSTPQIIDASNSLIRKNRVRIEKTLFTNNKNGRQAEHYYAKSDAREIEFIAENIEAHVKNGGKYGDCAVLYRSNYLSRIVENGLAAKKIPYEIFGATGFFERREIKDALSYMRLVANGDDLSFMRVINLPRRKIGKNKIAFVKRRAEFENKSLYETLKCSVSDPVFTGTGAAKFVETIENMKEYAKNAQVSELLLKLLGETGYERYIRESGETERKDNLAELFRSITALEADYGEKLTLSHYLDEIAFGLEKDGDAAGDSVKIMTAHIAKGLEFHTVFIAGMNEKVFPSARALEERREKALEEERRLCYVAMTRAKKMLFMTESEGEDIRKVLKTPSRFLFDIDDEFISRTGEIPAALMKEHEKQLHIRNPYTDSHFPVGTEVKHKIFGEGVIESLDMKARTYNIRFLIGNRTIRFDFKNLWRQI